MRILLVSTTLAVQLSLSSPLPAPSRDRTKSIADELGVRLQLVLARAKHSLEVESDRVEVLVLLRSVCGRLVGQ